MELFEVFAKYGVEAVILVLIGSVAGGAVSALATAWISYRHERLLGNRTHALEVYDSSLELIGRFRRDPQLALSEDYLTDVMVASIKVGAYGGKNVYDAMLVFSKKLNKFYGAYVDELNTAKDRYWDNAHDEIDPDSGEIVPIGEGLNIEEEKYEYIVAQIRSKNTPANSEAKSLCDSVVSAISKSIKPFASKRGF